MGYYSFLRLFFRDNKAQKRGKIFSLSILIKGAMPLILPFRLLLRRNQKSLVCVLDFGLSL